MTETSQDSSSSERFRSFAEFYPYYLGEHSDPTCRRLHYAGTSLTFVFAALGIFASPFWFLAMPVGGYFFAWIGHFFVEKNKPATFTYPFWSLMGDYKMFFSWLTGQLPDQLKAAGVAK